MESIDAIRLALPIFVEYQAANEDQIEAALTEAGIPIHEVHRVLEFVPLAFGRVLLAELGAVPREEYIRYTIQNGEIVEKERKKLVDDAFFATAMKVARSKRGWWKPRNEFLAIAERSAEVRAVRQLIAQGSKAANIVLTAPHFLFRD